MGLAVAFLLPLSFYLIDNSMSKGIIKMPGHYVIDKVEQSTVNGKPRLDTIYHTLNELTLTNQLGQTVSLNKDLAGKMLVIDFIFTDCAVSCPILSKNMAILQMMFKKDAKKEASLDTAVQFITITVNPERDSFPVMRAYADRFGANHDRWWFLTGDKKSIYNFARNELGVVTGPGDGGAEDFIHSTKLVLIDKDRYIRGYYEGLKDTSVRKCADDIVLLTLEKKRKKD